MISIDNLFVEFSAKPLFAGVSYVINTRDRIALVGKNGAGKSTMLKIIAGLQQPTGGTVSIPRETTVGYLPQVMKLADSRTVRQEAELAFSHIHEMQDELDRMNHQLAERTDYESADYMALVERFTQLDERFHMMGGANYQAELERTLIGLGFRQTDFERPTSEFSGGWRMRIELAKILLQRPDVLLLDEPTNHLDIESIQWLEQFLQNHQGAVVMVSHDRAFINNVTNRTIEISCGQIYDYKVRYDEYVNLRAERREQQLRAYENQQKEIAETKAFIERFRYQATKANQVQSRIKALEKIVPIEIDEVDNSRLRLRFTCSQRSGDFPIICEDVAKAYPLPLPKGGENTQGEGKPSSLGGERGERLVFSHVNLQLRRGEKVAFVGRNGEGKTTLVKCIMGQIPFDGTLKIGHNVEIGYFAQNQAQLLDEDLTVFETIDRVARGDIRLRIRDILGAFMFGGEESDKKVKVLSGGERTRLAMIKLLLEPVNLLILDEPTNHLDMRSKDVLKEAIRQFDGTVILVSHDRDFLDGLVSRVYVFGDGQVREHLGGIYDYLKETPTLSPPRGEGTYTQQTKTTTPLPREGIGGGVAWEAQKAQARQRKKLEKAVADAEQTIAELEQAIAILEAQMATPEGGSDMSLYERHGRLKQQLSKAEDEWTAAMEALEG
ncbi:MAG: ABC-F family ATP-binding cassette domain-containing protein [Bacteroidaceae bacterium]|nr:ABC-F family ATP-binding cassette domain-containing protein [Bacteroidaceae bacterium]